MIRVGLCLPNIHATLAGPETLVEAAGRAEAHGFDSVWVNDHVVVPTVELGEAADRQTQYLDRRSQQVLEPVVLLSYLAACTQRIALGTSVFVLALRNPVIAAKQVATLDVLSGGRAILGVGVGWVEAEFRALGVPWHQRGRRTDDGLRIARALWSADGAEGTIAGHELDGIEFNPRPAQQPRPPIWIGGRTDVGARRAARSGDAWHPSHLTLAELAGARARLDELCAEEGRGPAEVALTTRRRVVPGVAPSPEDGAVLAGDAHRMAEELDAMEAAGVSHVLLELDAAEPAALYDQIDWLGTELVGPRAADPVP